MYVVHFRSTSLPPHPPKEGGSSPLLVRFRSTSLLLFVLFIAPFIPIIFFSSSFSSFLHSFITHFFFLRGTQAILSKKEDLESLRVEGYTICVYGL